MHSTEYAKNGRPKRALMARLLAEQKPRERQEAEISKGQAQRSIDNRFKPKALTTRQKLRLRDRFEKVHPFAAVSARAVKRAIRRGSSPHAWNEGQVASDLSERQAEREEKAHKVAKNRNRPRSRRPHSPRQVDPELARAWSS